MTIHIDLTMQDFLDFLNQPSAATNLVKTATVKTPNESRNAPKTTTPVNTPAPAHDDAPIDILDDTLDIINDDENTAPSDDMPRPDDALRPIGTKRRENEEISSSPCTLTTTEEDKEEEKSGGITAAPTKRSHHKKVTDKVSFKERWHDDKHPSRELVHQYFEERQITEIDPDEFFDFYESRGWVLNKGVPIKSWTSCVNTWLKRRRDGISFYDSGRPIVIKTAAPRPTPLELDDNGCTERMRITQQHIENIFKNANNNDTIPDISKLL